jgi:FkbM family methyltransferase
MKLLESRYGMISASEDEDLITKSLTEYGEWAENELTLIKKFMKEGDTVLDVGTYLGTHLLAFSRLVGDTGKAIGFEPQLGSFNRLSETVSVNKLKNVEINNFALSDHATYLAKQKDGDVQKYNHGSFSLLDNEEVKATEEAIKVVTLDSLELTHVDFIKIDAEGMESQVLYGGTGTIIKYQPIIFCECNTVNDGNLVLNWAKQNSYQVVSVNILAFNPENFRNNVNDFFNGASEVSLILYPVLKQQQVNIAISGTPARRVVSKEDIYLTLLAKKQFAIEATDGIQYDLDYRDFQVFHDNYNKNDFDISEERTAKSIVIGVPLYKGPELVEPLYLSLAKCSDELNKYNVSVVFYNDSPDCEELNTELNRIFSMPRDFYFEISPNDKNLGFIGTTNRSIELAKERHADLIMLNSDTIFFPGVISELIAVAYSDPMIGFVSPRSNNATICTLPHEAMYQELSPHQALDIFEHIKPSMPRYTFVPTSVGFCLFVKNKIMQEVGALDPIYGRGYNEENDFIMRANRLGYRAVLANKALVWHEGEKSFGTLESKRNEREEHNAKILCERYPEYPQLINNYFQSVEYRAEALVSGVLPNSEGQITIGFEFTSLGVYHNGTFEAGKKLITAADKCWPKKYKLKVICGEESWIFHKLGELCSDRVSWCSPQNFETKMAAVVRIGQPFSADALSQMIYRAPTISCFMLDTIAADCGYLRLNFDENIWRFALNWTDVIFTNSTYTCSQFIRRYPVGEQVMLYPTLHSVSLNEYYSPAVSLREDVLVGSDKCKKILVIGNKFAHKGLDHCVAALAEQFSDVQFLVLGGNDYENNNVQTLPTGQLSDAEIERIYDDVDAIVFPSHYEGFGFPLLHSLAHKKPILLRDIPVYREITAKLSTGQDNVHFYSSTEEMIAYLKNDGIPAWVGGAAIGETNGWQRSANEVLNALELSMNQMQISHVAERLRWFELTYCNRPSASGYASPAENIAARLGGISERAIASLLRNQSIYRLARAGWRVVKKLKGR